ncbi:MAG TPA: V-type ATP synthase subunit F [Longimicrobiales bacterium]|nr:V-type ATP synthase subunit F [Longimicrobiales bacterium]
MTLGVGVIGNAFAELGFRLTGIRTQVADAPEAASGLLDGMVRDGGWGVILIQEDLLPRPLPAEGQRPTSGLPIVIPFPGPALEARPGEAEAYVAELLRQAVGYRVRLR